jgi:hypothetical protein
MDTRLRCTLFPGQFRSEPAVIVRMGKDGPRQRGRNALGEAVVGPAPVVAARGTRLEVAASNLHDDLAVQKA